MTREQIRQVVDEWIELQAEGWYTHHCQHGTTCVESFDVKGIDANDRDALIDMIYRAQENVMTR